jgi:hypothetical protein
VLNEEVIPYKVGLFGFGEFPERFIRGIGVPEYLGDEIVIGEEIVNSVEEKGSECGIIQMSMNIKHRGIADDGAYL